MIIPSVELQSQSLDICINNIQSNEGQICVAVFNSEEGFKTEKTFWEKYYPKTNLTDKTFKLKVQVPPGTYGVSILDDVNMDGKMKYNIIGIPREGFGFGNYHHNSFFKPRFSDFSFELKDNENIRVQVIMQYF
jgi:uncharacterized protein (DUF2141 family)